ncbi:MAG: efflux RND transporter permease subunit [Planctomycetota bacterium]|jgi:multidrug efflux pump subunit AcrB
MSIIRQAVRNPVAANMLMLLILGGGWFTATHLPRELFPEFSIEMVAITVAYPQASPEDVENSICEKIEEELSGMEDIGEITSTSREGLGTITVEVRTGADISKVVDDVNARVNNVTLPEEAEDPDVAEVTMKRHVVHVAVAWTLEEDSVSDEEKERTLKEIAEDIAEDLRGMPEMSQVTVSGVRDYEISVEVSEESLRKHQLTMARVSQAIREGSFDLPAGTVKTVGGDLTLRVIGQSYTAEEFRRIPVLSKPDGTIIRLRDVATVRESFEDSDVGGQFNSDTAALVSVFKTPEEDTVEIVQAVRRYVKSKQGELPAGIVIDTWADMSKLIQDRLDLLVRNGLQGLILVFLTLWLFLGVRLSIWVAVGIPVSFAGTLLVLDMGGQTMNMMSMFALIMALGLIVDDAIVVGENVYANIERGIDPNEAAVRGTKSVLWPVVGAVATTWLAFVPLMAVPDVMGKFIRILPFVIIPALAFSLLECIVILPPHLAHGLRVGGGGFGRRFREGFDRRLAWFLDHIFTPTFRFTTTHRYLTLSVFVAILILMGGAIKGGRIKVTGFPQIEGDTLRSALTLPTGTGIDQTDAVAKRISEAAEALNEQFTTESGEPVVQRVYALLGQQSGMGQADTGAHLAEITVELLPTEHRGERLRPRDLVAQWRENTGPIPEALSLTFSSQQGGPGGQALEVRVLGESTNAIKPVAQRIQEAFATYPGVTDISDDALPGKMEMRVGLKPGANTLGINLDMLARQLRAAFYGAETYRIQRGRDEIKVMVRYPEQQRQSLSDVEQMRIRTLTDDEVPFYEVATVQLERGYTTLKRIDRDSVITVSADVDEQVANAEEVLQDLSKPGGVFDQLRAEFPQIKLDLTGQRQQLFDSLNALKIWYPIALLGIYTILAAIFRSYFQPIIIMLAIPFGLIGAVIGHAIMGFELTLLSMFGMVALTGIVVNDALVLIDLINKRARSGANLMQAAETGARDRFRAILLTTVTTVMGMAPLLFERSFQAQFLKPMVVAIAFGLLFATLLTLLAVPSLYMIGNDIARVAHWLRRGRWPTAEQMVQKDAPVETDLDG